MMREKYTNERERVCEIKAAVEETAKKPKKKTIRLGERERFFLSHAFFTLWLRRSDFFSSILGSNFKPYYTGIVGK